MIDSYSLFEYQLIDACKEFPHLKIKIKGGKKILKGVIDIKDSEQKDIHSFLIEVHHTENFPYRFPILLEVGNDIPCDPDWHKYSDNSCCITVEPDEVLQCHNGITVSMFIKNNVIPYLANQCHKKVTGKYKNEFQHGNRGLISYYSELMETSDKDKWVSYLRYAFGIKKLRIGRNDKCICGSGKKFKNCHDIIFDKLKKIGKENIIKHLSSIL